MEQPVREEKPLNDVTESKLTLKSLINKKCE